MTRSPRPVVAILLPGVFACGCACGCATNPPPRPAYPPASATTTPTAPAAPAATFDTPSEIAVTHPDVDELWDAAESVLREAFYPIDRTDRRAGLLVSRPVVGAQPFEPWRQEGQTPADVAENALGTIWRTVRLEFSPHDAGGWAVEPKVLVQRQVVTERRVTNPVDYRAVFRRAGRRYTYPVRRDDAFERVLAERIARRLGTADAGPLTPARPQGAARPFAHPSDM